MTAYVCVVQIRLHVGDSHDLKGKRKLLHSLKSVLRRRFGAAVIALANDEYATIFVHGGSGGSLAAVALPDDGPYAAHIDAGNAYSAIRFVNARGAVVSVNPAAAALYRAGELRTSR